MLRRRFHLSLWSIAEKDAPSASGEGHMITAPLGQGAVKINAKKKRNPSILAAAFQNAWKQGNLTAEVSGCGHSYCGCNVEEP